MNDWQELTNPRSNRIFAVPSIDDTAPGSPRGSQTDMPETESQPETDDSEEIYDIPGGVTIRDRRDHRVAAFGCPWCEFTADSERLVRLHITQASSGNHRARNAFTDPMYVHALNDAGEQVDERPTGEFDPDFEGESSTSFLPAGVDPESRAGEILATALKYPGLSTTQYAERVYADTDAKPNAEYVKRVLDRHLSPPMATTTETEHDSKSYEELTDTQQTVVDAAAVNPGASHVAIARIDEVDVSQGYFGKVRREHEDLIQHRRAKHEAGTIDLSRLERATEDDSEPDLADRVADLTEKQRALLAEWVKHPDRNHTELEDAAGTSHGYFSKILSTHRETADALRELGREKALELLTDPPGGEIEVDIMQDPQEPAAAENGAEERESDTVECDACGREFGNEKSLTGHKAWCDERERAADAADTAPPESRVTLTEEQWTRVIRLISQGTERARADDLLSDIIKQV